MNAMKSRRLAPLALWLGACGTTARPVADSAAADGPDAAGPDSGTQADAAQDRAADAAADASLDAAIDAAVGPEAAGETVGGGRDGGGCVATEPKSTLYEIWCKPPSMELCLSDRLVNF